MTISSNKYGADTTAITFAFDAEAGKANVETTTKTTYTQDDTDGSVKAGAATVHLEAGKSYTANELTEILKGAGYDYTVTFADSDYTLGSATYDETGVTLTLADGSGVSSTDPDSTTASGQGLTFQIGANGTEDQRVSLSVKSQSTVGLGVATISVATQSGANSAISTIDKAINSVSGTRADLGALQNRLEHTINSLGVASENLTAAESRIRDVDMAKEMMNFTKTQILSQASQAMLAQANTLPQGVLQLLQ